jgi:hypothetical protein
MKSVSSLEEALKVLRHWKNSPRQMLVVSAGSDQRSTFSVQGYIAELSDEWVVVATPDTLGHVALSLPGMIFGISDPTGVPGDPIDIAKERFPLAEVIEIRIPSGGRALIIPSPIDVKETSKSKH